MATVYRFLDQQMLDREYSPSSCVDDIGVYIEEYERQSQAAKKRAIADGSCITDLRYGPHTAEVLDLFLPANPVNAPINIYIHGGFWQALSKEYSCFAAPVFQEQGCAFAALNYSLAPHRSLTDIVEENRRGIEWLYRNAPRFGIDPNRIFLSGSSAGAHLAMMMYVTDWSERGLPADVIKGVCAVSGVYDLEPVRLSYVNDKVRMDYQEAAANSPALLKAKCVSPVILAYGDNETGEFKRQTDDYLVRLEHSGTQLSFQEIPDRNHFDVILDLTNCDSWVSHSVLEQMNANPNGATRP